MEGCQHNPLLGLLDERAEGGDVKQLSLLCHECGKGQPLPPTWSRFPDEKICRWCRSKNVSVIDPAWVLKFAGKGGDFPEEVKQK